MITVSNLSKTYSAGDRKTLALSQVSFSVQKGETLALIGPSGAGKSTALRCLNLLERPDEGSIRVRGEELTRLGPKELRERRQTFGMIFQHFNLLQNRTVAGNVSLALEIAGWPKAEREKRVEEVLKLVKLDDKAKSYPSQLSGGQKQRAAIARAISNRPELLLADEPTSALDPLTKLEVIRCLEDLREQLGLTIVIATHEMGVVKRLCHRALLFKDHEIHEELKIDLGDVRPQTDFGKLFVEVPS